LKQTPPPGQTIRKRSAARTIGRIAAWVLGIPATLALLTYAVLLVHPIPLPFLAAQIRNVMVANMPAGTELELGDMALAVEGFAQPVIQFSPVTYRDTTTGAKVEMQALEIGFSPIHALFGQPGATVTVVGPHLQINQDIFGPRLSDFEIVHDPDGGPDTVRVLEGSTAFPDAGIHSEGIDVSGGTSDNSKVRSDNDWLVYNLEAAQKGIASVIEQAQAGRFSRMTVKKGTLDMNDALYGVLRSFHDITLDVAPTPDSKAVEGSFSASFNGTVMHGVLQRIIDPKGDARLRVSLTNFDPGSFVPNIDDKASAIGVDGSTAVSMDIGFDAKTGSIKDGMFHIDMTGTDLRIGSDLFPIASSPMEVSWVPQTGTFTLQEAAITVGNSSAHVSGVFVLGLDDLYGPIAAISMQATQLRLDPDGAQAAYKSFDGFSFKGWSAPLYGAVGIDQAILTKADARIESKGRIDMLRKGMGFDMSIAGEGVTADDVKRVWPYFMAGDARKWFAQHVLAGKIESATMKYAFPVGTIGPDGETKSIPQNGIFMEIVADGVRIQATDNLQPIDIQGKTRIQMHDSEFTLSGDGGVLATPKGNIQVANAAMVMSSDTPGQQVVEISGDLNGGIPALVSAANQFQPGITSSKDLPVDVSALDGDLNVRLVSTTTIDTATQAQKQDYTISGNVQDFGSSAPIQGHTMSNGQLSFMATPAGYNVGGTAQIDGLDADLMLTGELKQGSTPQMTLSSTVKLADLAKLGFDASQFGTGSVSFTAKPDTDGTLGISLDLKNAAINIQDLGISKDAGVPGTLTASIAQKGTTTDISDVKLGFGDVKLAGSLEFDSKKGLQSAEFSNFALSPGDAAQISLTPIKDGYQVRIRGDQLDLKPMLKRFFSLDQGSGGPQATAFSQTIAVDAQLKRALGMYKTTAYNLALDMALKGTDLRKVSLQAQLGNNSSVSIATNPTPEGRTLAFAFNDLGSLLRFVGVYPQVEGGSGSLVISTDTTAKVDTGNIDLKNFAIVDEKHVAEILDSHAESRDMIARSNKLVINSAKVDFTRRADRVQVNDAVVTGPTVGGQAEGFIYTDRKQFDLAGTYIPMFGINNAFGRLFGPLGGGLNGGLFGITFQVVGPLSAPVFKINPMSALAPGAFRSLFEYRAKEQPRTDGSDGTEGN